MLVKTRKEAFTIVECVITLSILAVIVLLLSFEIRALKISPVKQYDQPLDWYICLQELESNDHRFELEEVGKRQVELKSLNTGVSYELHGSDRLYLSREHYGGYMLLFSDVKPGTVSFKKLPGGRLIINCKRNNGNKLEGIVKFAE